MKPISIAIALLLTACSSLKPGCIIQNQGSAAVSKVIVTQLQCANPAAVQADILAAFGKLNLCSAQKIQGPIADTICPAVTKFVSTYVATQTVPAAWGCSGTNAQAALQVALLSACQQLPLAPKAKK